MKVQRAENCWIGVVKGAILRGMGIGMAAAATVRPCPRHYGICVSQKYEAWRNSSDNTVRDSFNGETMVPDQLFWLIRKGDAILPDGPIVSNFSVRCKFTRQQYDRGSGVRITFVASSTHSPPTTLAKLPRGMASLCITHSLPSVSGYLQPYVRQYHLSHFLRTSLLTLGSLMIERQKRDYLSRRKVEIDSRGSSSETKTKESCRLILYG